MKNFKKGLAGLTLSASLLMAGCTDTQDEHVLQVGDHTLTDDELYATLAQEPMGGGYTFGERIVEQRLVEWLLEMEYGDQITSGMVDQSIQEAIDTRGGEEEYDAYLEAEGFTREYMEDSARSALLYDIALHTHYPVDEQELKEMFERQIPVGTRVAHILVEEERLAQSLIDKLNEGADFVELLNEHTLDESSLSRDGQYTIVQGDFEPAFEQASLDLKRDEITSEPVKTSHGYHVIQSISEGNVRTFEESRERLENLWYQELFQKNEVIYESIVYELVDKYQDDIVITSEKIGDVVSRILSEKPSNEPIMDTPEPDEDIEILLQSDDEEELMDFLENELSDLENEENTD